jgi:hypothetical protein
VQQALAARQMQGAVQQVQQVQQVLTAKQMQGSKGVRQQGSCLRRAHFTSHPGVTLWSNDYQGLDAAVVAASAVVTAVVAAAESGN